MSPVRMTQAPVAIADGMTGRAATGSVRPAASLHLLGRGNPPCGIGDFSRLLLEHLSRVDRGTHQSLTLEAGRLSLGDLWRALDSADCVVANFPVVAWKRALIEPLAVYALARLRGRSCVTIMHEWRGLHPLRRLALRPLLLLSTRILMVSPQVREELAADPVIGFLARRAALLPVPPNLARPASTEGSALRERLLAARDEGRLVLGHFGSIYPGKQPEAVLEIAAALKAQGARPLLAFIGSFIKGSDGIEDLFARRVEELGLGDDVVVSGYVATEAELFGLFEAVDAFAYVLPEGLTSRRASVLACVQAGRPVVVTAPARSDEFDHHPRYRALVESGAIALVERSEGPDAYARRILEVRGRATMLPEIDVATWFGDAALVLRDQLGAPRERATAG